MRIQMNLSYSVSRDAVRDCALEGSIEGFVRVTSISVQHQIEGGSSRTVISFLSILQSVPPEVPEFWSAGCNFEPVVANEEEVAGSLS